MMGIDKVDGVFTVGRSVDDAAFLLQHSQKGSYLCL
jgi:hypothetical protein